MILWLTLFSAVQIASGIDCKGGKTFRRDYTTKGYFQDNDIKSFDWTSERVDDCQAECEKEESCKGFEYNIIEHICRLSTLNADDIGSAWQFVEDDQWVLWTVKCDQGTSSTSTTATTTTTTPLVSTTAPPKSKLCSGVPMWAVTSDVNFENAMNYPYDKKTSTSLSACLNRCTRHDDSFNCSAVTYNDVEKDCSMFEISPAEDLLLVYNNETTFALLSCQENACAPGKQTRWKRLEGKYKSLTNHSLVIEGLTDPEDCMNICLKWSSFQCLSMQVNASGCTLFSEVYEVDDLVDEAQATYGIRCMDIPSGESSDDQDLESPFAIRPQYIVLIGMGLMIIALVGIIIGVVVNGPRKPKRADSDSTQSGFPY